MKTLFDNQFIEISLDEAHGIIEMLWHPLSARMSEEEFKTIFNTFADLVEQHRPSFCLSHDRSQAGDAFVVMPHLQEWLDKEIVPRTYGAGMRTTGFVVNEDIFSQVSIEQTMEEPNAHLVKTRFFADYDSARKWLVQQALEQTVV